MLELKDLSLQVGTQPDAPLLLAELGLRFPRKHFAAILGPSGCGKSTLLKTIAGLREPSEGHVEWDGVDLAEEDMDPHEIGYVPQFSIAFDLLTVWESVEAALRLRVGGLDVDEEEVRVEKILEDVGMVEIADRRVSLLSGGQKRRLAMALEMVSAPHLLLCDEVTSGLDPKAEDEIVHLMHRLSRGDERIVLSVTHSLRHLALYDSVVVLYQGRLAYHGAASSLYHYFGVEQPEELFPRLAMRTAEEWHRSWQKHRDTYYQVDGLAAETVAAPSEAKEPAAVGEAAETAEAKGRLDHLFETLAGAPEETAPKKKKKHSDDDEEEAEGKHRPPPLVETPSALRQYGVLLARRWKLFFRDRGAVILQLALLLGFPCLVVIFALDGLPQLKTLAASGSSQNFLQQLQNEYQQLTEFTKTGSLVSGLVMFQVILLALMGSNNSAREIAAERLIFEKEKFAGLRPGAYVASKVTFLGVLVLAQSLWMGLFVNFWVKFPGDLASQLLVLTMANAALTAVCLGISSVMKSAEQASLVSVYLVGFQLPLSGAVLALPSALGMITRPFIASYWGWSGFISAMRDTRSYDAVLKVTQTNLSAVTVCVWVLGFHVILGVLLAYTGSKHSRWE